LRKSTELSEQAGEKTINIRMRADLLTRRRSGEPSPTDVCGWAC